MRKLELSQMENLQGTGHNRDCMLMGALTGISWPFMGIGGVIAGIGGAISMGCFSY